MYFYHGIVSKPFWPLATGNNEHKIPTSSGHVHPFITKLTTNTAGAKACKDMDFVSLILYRIRCFMVPVNSKRILFLNFNKGVLCDLSVVQDDFFKGPKISTFFFYGAMTMCLPLKMKKHLICIFWDNYCIVFYKLWLRRIVRMSLRHNVIDIYCNIFQ